MLIWGGKKIKEVRDENNQNTLHACIKLSKTHLTKYFQKEKNSNLNQNSPKGVYFSIDSTSAFLCYDFFKQVTSVKSGTFQTSEKQFQKVGLILQYLY